MTLALPRKAQAYLLYNLLAAAAISVYAAWTWESREPIRFVCYFLIATLAGGLKVHLPGILATMSVNFFFVLLGILELGFSETVVMGCAACLVQCYWNAASRPRLVQVVFNVSSMAKAVAVSYWIYHSWTGLLGAAYEPLWLALAASAFFFMNTVPVSMIVALTEERTFRSMWTDCYFWSFPYYLLGAAIAGVTTVLNGWIGWQTGLLILPVVFWVYRSYNLYLGRLRAEKQHAEEIASLQLRTIEALALAIDAKDRSTHEHLKRVRVYAEAIGKEMGLSAPEMEALRAAALLHDIGKLAVPEHILSKPGRLTPEEFEKMKVHPVVGAEILERVQFPYPVVPIVRSHHEKWDGSGYPDGLVGEAIPIGARILTAVDVLDALATHRQYRAAMPLPEAMNYLVGQAGRTFDPKVIEILARRYQQLERLAQGDTCPRAELSTDIKVQRGESPAAGLEIGATDPQASSHGDFLTSIASARQEAQGLFEITQTLGNSLHLEETLSVVCARLHRLIPCDSIAIFVQKDQELTSQCVVGENFRQLSALRVRMGEGLIGWVAMNRKPIVNGNPAMELGGLEDFQHPNSLRAVVAVPLEGTSGVVGVLALYQCQPDFFTQDHLRILLAISPKVALSIENALRFQIAESSATTDYLTGLPNTRSLFLHMDRELARSRRAKSELSVLVCDLNGFKQVNDRFGHMAGNRVLQVMARKLRDACREYDYVARLGGDEFVIVAPGMTPQCFHDMKQRFNELARDASLVVCGEALLSVSVGEANYPAHGGDADQLLAEADRRMYVAKHAERALLKKENSVSVLALQSTAVC